MEEVWKGRERTQKKGRKGGHGTAEIGWWIPRGAIYIQQHLKCWNWLSFFILTCGVSVVINNSTLLCWLIFFLGTKTAAETEFFDHSDRVVCSFYEQKA